MEVASAQTHGEIFVDPWLRSEIDFLRMFRACETQTQNISSANVRRVQLQLAELSLMLQGLSQASATQNAANKPTKFDAESVQEFERKLELLERILQEFLSAEAVTQSSSVAVSEEERKTKRSLEGVQTQPAVVLKEASPRSMLFNRRTRKSGRGAEKEMENLVENEHKTQEALKHNLFNMVNEMKSKVSGINQEIEMDMNRLDPLLKTNEENLRAVQTVQTRLNVAISNTTSTCKTFVFIAVITFAMIIFTKLTPKFA